MPLRSLKISNFKGLERLELGPFGPGLNLLSAPNGRGKSTILAAMAQGLFTHHKSKADELQQLRPWGRALTPELELEFSRDGILFRLRRRLLDQPKVELETFGGDDWRPLAAGEEAEKRLRLMWGADPEARTRGQARPEDWGWGRLLWAQEGELPLSGLAAGPREILGEILGRGAAAPGQAAFEAALTRRYEEFFTATGRPSRKAGRRTAESLAEELGHARAAWEQARRELEGAERERLAAEKAGTEAVRLSGELKALGEALAQARALEAGRKGVKDELEKTRLELGRLKEEAGNVRDRFDRLARLETEKNALAEELKNGQASLDAAETSAKEAKAEHARLERLGQARESAALERRWTEAEAAQAEAAGLEAELKRLGEEHRRLAAPNPRELESYHRARLAHELAALALHSAELVLTLDFPGREIRVLSGRLEQGGDGPAVLRGLAGASAEVIGLGRVSAAAANAGAAGLEENFERAAELWEKESARWGADPAALEERVSRARELETAGREAKARMESLKPAELAARLAELTAARQKSRERLEALGPGTAPGPAIGAAPEDSDAALFEENLGKARLRHQQSHTALELARQNLAVRKAALEKAGLEAARLSQELGPLDGARQKQDDRLLRLAALEAAERRRTMELAALPAPEISPDELEISWRAAGEAERVAREELSRARGFLESAGEAGLVARLRDLALDDERLTALIMAEERRRDAVSLLYRTYQERRQAVTDGPARRLAPLAEEFFQRLLGGRFQSLGLDENFKDLALSPAGLPPGSETPRVAPEALSAGERDLLHLSARLAAAQTLLARGPQLLVLDDVIAHFDGERVSRLLEELTRLAGQGLQTLLFTCRDLPPVPGAVTIDLDPR